MAARKTQFFFRKEKKKIRTSSVQGRCCYIPLWPRNIHGSSLNLNCLFKPSLNFSSVNYDYFSEREIRKEYSFIVESELKDRLPLTEKLLYTVTKTSYVNKWREKGKIVSSQEMLLLYWRQVPFFIIHVAYIE